MRNLNEATLYPGIGAIEWTNLSVGRGTDTPFEHIGAPWIDGVAARRRAERARDLPGVRFYPVRFTPTSSKYANEECQGVFIVVTDRAALRPVRVGVEIAVGAAPALSGASSRSTGRGGLFGSTRRARRAIKAGDDPAAIAASWGAAEARWRLLRAKYLLYRQSGIATSRRTSDLAVGPCTSRTRDRGPDRATVTVSYPHTSARPPPGRAA